MTRYGIDLGSGLTLTKLLEELVKLPNYLAAAALLLSDRVTDQLIDIIAREEKICNYIDIPIQHINPAILKRMNRHSLRPGSAAS